MESVDSMYPSEDKPKPLAVGDFLLRNGATSRRLYVLTKVPNHGVVAASLDGGGLCWMAPVKVVDESNITGPEAAQIIRPLNDGATWHRLTHAEAAKWLALGLNFTPARCREGMMRCERWPA